MERHHFSQRLRRWGPALLASMFLLAGLEIHHRVLQGEFFPVSGELPAAAPAERPTSVHHLTAEMLLPDGHILVIDRQGEGGDAVCSLATVGPDGEAAVLYRNRPGEGLMGGVYGGGRRFNLAGPDGVYHVDRLRGLLGWFPLPEGEVLEDLEAGFTLTRRRHLGTGTTFALYRGMELRREYHLPGSALAARLSPSGSALGLLSQGLIQIVSLQGRGLIAQRLEHRVTPDLILSESGEYALVCRADGAGVGLVGPEGVRWYEVRLSRPYLPLEAGVGELHPDRGRFALTDGRRLFVGSEKGSLRSVMQVESGEALHLGEWTRERGILLTVQRRGIDSRRATDRFYFVDPCSGKRELFRLTPRHARALSGPARCTAGFPARGS